MRGEPCQARLASRPNRMTDTIKTVGVIGAGRMGQPIIGHMARKGFSVVAYDIDAARRDIVTKLGARWADSAAALARDAEAVLICVGYDRQLGDLASADGLLKPLPRGAI